MTTSSTKQINEETIAKFARTMATQAYENAENEYAPIAEELMRYAEIMEEPAPFATMQYVGNAQAEMRGYLKAQFASKLMLFASALKLNYLIDRCVGEMDLYA